MATCCATNCKKYLECKRAGINNEGIHTARDYSTSGIYDSNNNIVEYYCGELGNYKKFEPKKTIKEGQWIKVHGYITAGGDPVYRCSNCGCSEHVYGIEHPDKQSECKVCGSKNIYPWEKNDEQH